jgi:hypothetical protein
MAKLDLSNQDLSFENDFLVAVEWIDFENKENVRIKIMQLNFHQLFSVVRIFQEIILILNGIVKSNVKRRTWNSFKSERIF